jgi:NADH-quinone oxidoreductase subunit G
VALGEPATALYLLHADPLRMERDRTAWQAALAGAQAVIAHASTLTETVREHADVVFPAEAYAEKEGTLVHPDGRVQRLRPAIGRPGSLGAGVRPGWQVITELAARCGLDLGVLAGPMASRQLFDAVPFYAGLSLDAIGGRGVRWPAGPAAETVGAGSWELARLDVPPVDGAPSNGSLRLGTWRSLWAAPEVDLSPALQFMRPQHWSSSRRAMPSGWACVTAIASRWESRSRPAKPARGTARGYAQPRGSASIPGGSVFWSRGRTTSPPTGSPGRSSKSAGSAIARPSRPPRRPC